MNWRLLLYPFTLLYGSVTTIRNKFFDWQLLSSKRYDTPLISIGNITVGGTGKTPLSEYVIRLLQNNYQVALLSRGYKRQTKGALLADKNSLVREIGDEPFQMLQKFKGLLGAVAEKRQEGMSLLLSQVKPDVVLMDDAYQHRYVTPGLSILVIDYNRPLWNDYPFPAGNLRETRSGQKRADVIVVNKCPNEMCEEEKNGWLKRIKATDKQQVFFSSVSYGGLQSFSCQGVLPEVKEQPVIGLAGIAKPEAFFSHLRSQYDVKETIGFSDHHNFTGSDIVKLTEALDRNGEEAILITTEKDAVRLKELELLPVATKERIWYIPIELQVLFNEGVILDKIITDYVRNNQRNS